MCIAVTPTSFHTNERFGRDPRTLSMNVLAIHDYDSPATRRIVVYHGNCNRQDMNHSMMLLDRDFDVPNKF